MIKRLLLFSACILAVCIAKAQIAPEKLDQLVQNTLKTFDVPGISVGILKDGKLIYAKGHGVRSLKTKQAMDENTLVGIASNSKGFTCMALGMLVDEGKISWDDKVIKHLPDFKMYDETVTKEITIKDLVTHRAGLGLGQGDLMFFPEGGTLSVENIVYNVRFLKPYNSFRNNMDYNNVMFIVAGEVIRKVSGLSWAEFIETRILKPVGMVSSMGSYNRVKNKANIIDAHAPVNGKAVAIPHDWNETANAAGGIMSNITDMAVWAEFLMNGGVTKEGKRLISEKQMNYLWQMQTPLVANTTPPYNTTFYGYALGWFVSDVKGHKQIQHTGGLLGTVTQFTLIPDMKLAIIVLTNQQVGAAFSTITNTIKDSYLGVEDRNWLKTYSDRVTKAWTEANKVTQETYKKVEEVKTQKFAYKTSDIVGVYKDVWFGEIEISSQNNKLRILCKTSPRLRGELLAYSENTFVAKWDDRSYDADAFVIVSFDKTGKAEAFKMKAISPMTDFSFDFQNLDLKRIK